MTSLVVASSKLHFFSVRYSKFYSTVILSTRKHPPLPIILQQENDIRNITAAKLVGNFSTLYPSQKILDNKWHQRWNTEKALVTFLQVSLLLSRHSSAEIRETTEKNSSMTNGDQAKTQTEWPLSTITSQLRWQLFTDYGSLNTPTRRFGRRVHSLLQVNNIFVLSKQG